MTRRLLLLASFKGDEVSHHAGADRLSRNSLVHTSQKTLPSASTAASPPEPDLEAFLETLAGLSSSDSSLAMKLLRRLPIEDLWWERGDDVKVVGEVDFPERRGIRQTTRDGSEIAVWMADCTRASVGSRLRVNGQ